MLLIILAVLSIIIAWNIMDMEFGWSDISDYFMTLVLTVLLWMLSVLIIYFPVALIANTEPSHYEDIKISALKDNSIGEGSFFLGSGNVDEEQYYFYITETEKGKKMNKVEAESAYIKESTGEAYVSVYVLEYSKFMKWMLFADGVGYEYIFHVPNNTVTSDFEVDME